MGCKQFIPWKPHAITLTVVERANVILDEYFTLGFKVEKLLAKRERSQ
jgi:hypothetical protein